jgi:hypothetical protein
VLAGAALGLAVALLASAAFRRQVAAGAG